MCQQPAALRADATLSAGVKLKPVHITCDQDMATLKGSTHLHAWQIQ